MALTVVPAVALLALWSFAMVSVTGDLRALIRLQSVYETFGTPVDTAVGQIQIERRLAAAYLGAGQRNAGAADAAALLAQQRATDHAVGAMLVAVGDRERREDLSGRQRESLDAMARAAARLDALREEVVDRRLSWSEAVDAYTAIVEPTFDVQSQLTALQAGQLAREAQVVVELVRVREFVSREDALVAGARAAGLLTDGQYDTLTAAIEDRRVFHRTYVPDLPADSRKLFTDFQRGAEYRALTSGEDALLRAGAANAGQAMADASWRTTTDRAVKRYMLLCTESALNAAERGRAFAYREMVKAAVVGLAGLAAVALSVWLSVSAGRRIARRLEELRDAAEVLATRRLPEVMERLGAGEDVDPAAAAPPLDFADGDGEPDEIAQVGTALNAARRAAVEAAVKQATLRRGIFAVLLNIARRNQALVHRQAKFVDTLERRTTDPDTLEDLFRIDHLTTRMRRHAEGLIILSGAAPGRRWRRPVPLVDVVAAAVGEIEDYTRVVVPPMPAVGVGADAVADVVHLVAELVENATAFSPPHTQVTMRTGEARNGFVLEIDDRGLGMDGEELAQAHRTLARPGDFDPVQDERLGLYIVGRLAARHGITVTLTRSPYGGTTAVVLLPHTIITPAAPEPDPGASSAPVREPAAAPSGGAVAPRAGRTPPDAGAVVHALPLRTAAPAELPAEHGGAAPPEREGATGPRPAGDDQQPGIRPGADGAGIRAEADDRDTGVRPAVGGEQVGDRPAGGGGAAGVRAEADVRLAGDRPVADERTSESRVRSESEPGVRPGPDAPQAAVRTPGDRPLPLPTRRRPRPLTAERRTGRDLGTDPGPERTGPGTVPGAEGTSADPAWRSGSGQEGGRAQARTAAVPAPPARDGRPAEGVGGAAPIGDGRPARGEPAPAPDPAPRTLPVRIRQASLAAPLREGSPGGEQDGSGRPEREVSAEEMRAIFGAFQRGLDRGRRSEPHGNEPHGSEPHEIEPRVSEPGRDERRGEERRGTGTRGSEPHGSAPAGRGTVNDEGTRDDG
ncbi:nitrate- and nitrite sensing domain-containing protein [Streptomyces sp. NPDC007883]|uniref:sensor histidine kinase n=1 Tax=Streptomyces sp. NPDC007883 TaxID=3155116 RepID=UPI0033D3E176